MNIFTILKTQILKSLQNLVDTGKINTFPNVDRVTTESPRDASLGDVATNVAMVCANQVNMKPRDFALIIAEELKKLDSVDNVEVAGPGFINLKLSTHFWCEQLKTILTKGLHYGDSNIGKGEKINVEYCSANPTGPLHVGHIRASILGSCIANLLSKVGYDVTSEYYINDAGGQMDKLAKSAYLRYHEALGEDIGEIPAGYYPGDYLKDVAKAIVEKDGDKWMNINEADCHLYFREFACKLILDDIKKDLADVGIHFDVFTSELAIRNSGGIERALDVLKQQDLIYTGIPEKPKSDKAGDDWEPHEMLLFRSSKFGDETDRPLARADGTYTYFMPDIAYQYDKFTRGFKHLIVTLGADHGGYVKRLTSAVEAVTQGQAHLEIPLVQMVSFSKNGQPFKMSKRNGTIVLVRDLLSEVDKDVLRFFIMTRKNDSQLEFDFVKVKEQSKDNPVFYVQYAYARANSVFRHAQQLFGENVMADIINADLSLLKDEDEIALIRLMAEFPRQIETAASVTEPHRIAYYLNDLASAFHSLWNKGRDDVQMRFLDENKPELSKARLALLQGVCYIIASGLAIFGVEPAKEM